MRKSKSQEKTANELKVRQQTLNTMKSRLFEYNSIQVDSNEKLLMYQEQVYSYSVIYLLKFR